VFAGKGGIIGALHEELIDISKESPEAIKGLIHTPSGAFGSCRFKLGAIEKNRREYERLIEVFKAHDIGYFFYNGGGDSQDTTHKMSLISRELGYPLTCIGIPKTVDNDLSFTDNSPGFGSVAKYVAVSILEASLDVASMANSSTKIFILEVMGRHAGWIAAAAGLAAKKSGDAPQIILFPEIPFDPEKFLRKVDACVKKDGFCSIVVSEGVRDKGGKFLSESGLRDAFGHAQLGGVAPVIANLIREKLGYKYHYAIADYLQRAARHIASKTDVEQAYALGEAAVNLAVKGVNGVMPIVERLKGKKYRWRIGTVPLEKVANQEKHLPRNFIDSEGFGITKACRDYLLPLIQGEAYPPFKEGLPQYIHLKKVLVKKKCPKFVH
jgi:6-phosphofructokinase 1